jgi:hypothetical protein
MEEWEAYPGNDLLDGRFQIKFLRIEKPSRALKYRN